MNKLEIVWQIIWILVFLVASIYLWVISQFTASGIFMLCILLHNIEVKVKK
jgi:hypothetical protein